MKEQRLRRAEDLQRKEDKNFLDTVLAVEEREARKARQAMLSALAKQKEAEREQEWLTAALSFEESRIKEIEEGAEPTEIPPTIPVPNLQAEAPTGVIMPQGAEPYWERADVPELEEQEASEPRSESSPARTWSTLQPDTLKMEKGAAKPDMPNYMQEELIISMQTGAELGTLHGQEEQLTRSPCSPPPSRARKDQKNLDRMSARRKEQRRQQMLSSRNLSPDDAGATAINLKPDTTLKPIKPASGQETPHSLQTMPRDPPQATHKECGHISPQKSQNLFIFKTREESLH